MLISLGLVEPVSLVKVAEREHYYAIKETSVTTGLTGSQANNLRFDFYVLFGERISLSLLQMNAVCWGGEQVLGLVNETGF